MVNIHIVPLARTDEVVREITMPMEESFKTSLVFAYGRNMPSKTRRSKDSAAGHVNLNMDYLSSVDIFFNVVNSLDRYLTSMRTVRYDVGDYFGMHKDTKVSPSHVGTLLLIPPKDMYSHEGGVLKVSGRDIVAHQTRWTIVVFSFREYHEVQKVTSGTRYVFKYQVHSDILQPAVAKRMDAGVGDNNRRSSEEEEADDFFDGL